MATFKGVKQDSKILHIGDLFRSTTAKFWRINIWLDPKHEKRHANFSNFPAFARGRILNAVLQKPEREKSIRCSITENSVIAPCKLSDFSELGYPTLAKAEAKQNGIMVKTQGQPDFIIPQLELARVLFMHSGYLCRAALTSATLLNEFDVIERLNRDEAVINVLSLSSFPKKAFDDAGTRRMLSWLLLDSNARASFDSIFKNYRRDARAANGWETWTFSFDPPEMTGWSFRFEGRLNEVNNNFFVEEITDMTFRGSLPGKIWFHHPSFKRYDENGSRGKPNGSPWTQRPDDHEINADTSASSKSDTVLIRNAMHTISFLGATETAKYNLVVDSATNSSLSEPPEIASEEVSTDEPTEGGVLAAADFAGPDDQSDLTRVYESRFEAFNHMLELLQDNGVILLSKTVIPLPQSGRGKKHLLITGEPRVICCAAVSFQGRRSYILEIDTSDGQSKLSSKVFRTDERTWNELWLKLLTRITDKLLSWPSDLINESFTNEQVTSVNHPSNAGAGQGKIPTDTLTRWTEKFLNLL